MNTNKNDEVAKDATAQAVPEAPAQPGADPVDAPNFGFDDKGYFVVRVHSTVGYHAIQGYLLEAQAFLRGAVLNQQRQEMEKKKILKPNEGKFRGRFNLFK